MKYSGVWVLSVLALVPSFAHASAADCAPPTTNFEASHAASAAIPPALLEKLKQGSTIETDQYKDIFREAIQLGEVCKPENVLLVFDLDNTLMKMDDAIGSEQWFDWQESLITSKTPSDESARVAKDFNGLIEADKLAKDLVGMEPIEPTLPKQLAEMQQKGFKTMILTSRRPAYKAATFRELKENGFQFGRSTLSVPIQGPYLPYDPQNLGSSGFSEDEGKDLNLSSPREVEFDEGVYFTSGQNKGAMLRTILQKSSAEPCGIIFVDNKGKYHDQMRSAFKSKPTYLLDFRYSREDQAMESFKDLDKGPIIKQWNDLKLRSP